MIRPKFSTYTHILFLLFSSSSSFYSFAQSHPQINIITESGEIAVLKTREGKDMILFPAATWDEMQKNTRYTSVSLSPGVSKQFCIEIARKNKFHCRSGIGFSCSVFDCPGKCRSAPVVVDASNRICSVMLQRQETNMVKLIFLDKVNWKSLQDSTK